MPITTRSNNKTVENVAVTTRKRKPKSAKPKPKRVRVDLDTSNNDLDNIVTNENVENEFDDSPELPTAGSRPLGILEPLVAPSEQVPDEFEDVGGENEADIDIEEDVVEEEQASPIRNQTKRGKDRVYEEAAVFEDNREYKNSDEYKSLGDLFNFKRKYETDAGIYEEFLCKHFRKAGFHSCSMITKVLYPSDTLGVVVLVSGEHEHVEKETEDSNKKYNWTTDMIKVIEDGIHMNGTAVTIRREMRRKGLFENFPEPSKTQLNNKIQYERRRVQATSNIMTTRALREAIKAFNDKADLDEFGLPADEKTPYVIAYNVDDETDDVEFYVIFTTRKISKRIENDGNVHVDATYRINWQDYPLLIYGVTEPTGKFHPSGVMLASNEKASTWSNLFKALGDLSPSVRLADGAKEITNADSEVLLKNISSL